MFQYMKYIVSKLLQNNKRIKLNIDSVSGQAISGSLQNNKRLKPHHYIQQLSFVKDYYKITRLSNLKVPRIGMSTDTFIL